ncbi:MAG: Acyl-CoA synthetase forming [Dehalococcoidia bacterium]|nr:Acyl-CoA synthetase forming [Dehalococcoidia bacterium]
MAPASSCILRGSTMHKLDRVFYPRSVAVVGSKQVDNHSWLRTVLPFQGPKYHVNIDRSEWASAQALGFPSYPSLMDVPGDVDFVIVSVPAQVVPGIIKDCIAKGVVGVHLYTAGFSETGTEEGVRLEKEVAEMARAGRLQVVGPNCVGVFNPDIGLGVNIGGYHGSHGELAFISQSGSQASGFTRAAAALGIKASKVVSMGNGIVLDSPDYIEYLGQDVDTKVIGLYLEGVRDGRRFFNVLREVSPRKPVLVWKVGETEDAARAVAVHSTTKTTNPAIWDAMIRQCGAIKSESANDLLETAKLLLWMPPVTGNRVGVLALSGGHSTEMSNIFSKAGLSVPRLTEASYKRILQRFNVVGSTYWNPIEGRTLSDPVTMNNVLDVLNEDANIDVIVHELSLAERAGKVTLYRGHGIDVLRDFRSRARKPYMAILPNSFPPPPPELFDNAYNQLIKAGIPTVIGAANAARALRQVADYYRFRSSS